MAKQSNVQVISDESLKSGYEVSDISRKAVAIGTGVLIVLTAAMIIGLILIFFWWKGWIQSFYNHKYFLKAPEQIPQQPRLQDNPYGDYQQWLKKQEKILNSISIDEAMDELIKENEGKK